MIQHNKVTGNTRWVKSNDVASGKLDQSYLDTAITNVLSLRFRLGLFDPIKDQPLWHVPKDAVRAPEHVAAATDSTDQGLVLLQNLDSRLPFDDSKATAVIGPLSTSRSMLVGNYLGQICPGLDSHGNENFNCVQSLAEAVGNVTGASKLTVVPGLPSVKSTDTSGFAATNSENVA